MPGILPATEDPCSRRVKGFSKVICAAGNASALLVRLEAGIEVEDYWEQALLTLLNCNATSCRNCPVGMRDRPVCGTIGTVLLNYFIHFVLQAIS